MNASGTTANASFTSHRSTSSSPQPARLSAFCAADTGAVVNHSGSCACEPKPTSRAIGFAPVVRAVSAVASTSAAAPSLSDEALAGVIVPAGANDGRSFGIFS